MQFGRGSVDCGVDQGCVALDIDRSCRVYMFFPGRDHRIFVQYAEEKTNIEVLVVLCVPALFAIHMHHRFRQVWGAYTQPQQLDGLLASLDQRGCRDAALYEALCVNYSRCRASAIVCVANVADAFTGSLKPKRK